MKKRRHTPAVLTLVLAMFLSLTACSTLNTSLSDLASRRFDAAAYIQGQLDEIYLGKFDPDYLEMVGITESEARQVYEDGMDVEVEAFIQTFAIEFPTDDFKERMALLYRSLYAYSDYTVVSAARQDDGSYSVKVSVRPLDTIQLLYDAFPDFQEEFQAKYSDVDTDAMSDEEFNDWYENIYDLDYQNSLADLFEETIPKTGTLEEKSIAVQIEKDDEDYYVMNDESFSNLDALIIDYVYS
ncbi:conserved exported hypothetical protein [uncultured Eubacteriales bacterium]|uniref:DUF5105 domain-containing protein n=1 Tax=uncultured Eubacteriales bacterium TaxID=172733 RepID=A0A212KDY0_9FIRM|nr:conserved exported hypothetical protein [uncultured Eubacteriales bacterium]